MGDIYHAGETYAGSVPINDDPSDVSDKTVRSSEYIKQFEDGVKPYKVLVTAAANQTYTAQMGIIKNAFDALSEEIKYHTALLIPVANGAKNIYQINANNGIFYRATVADSSAVNHYLNTATGKYYRANITSTQVSFSDLSGNTNNYEMILILI